ncbi:DUF4185 domain-containing protein [Arenibacter troitsensis]|uniref:DUF4185 domain-containing protein n=1 Tax=Arenibacter troitsensis TaxID=188872 RepID=A0A1X7KKP8_9FLAO|nr:DUF4185 domain-containing protein [Arenibacter troitsensis]SMG41213.1 protein of unknown function [Arenibacter troitsensis]
MKIYILTSVVNALLMVSCSPNKKSNTTQKKCVLFPREISAANDFEKLVMVDSLGVTGADGVISFSLDDSTSIFMMGDSFLSPVQNKKRDINSPMVNNTFIAVNKSGETHTALYQGTMANPDAFLKPINGNPDEYYWPGHGFESNGKLHVFMSRFLHGDGAWGFEFSGTDYITLDAKTFRVISQQDLPYSNLNNVHYGHSGIHTSNYTYIYGAWSSKDSTALHVARGKLNRNTDLLDSFEFFDGKGWTADPIASAPLIGVVQPVPEQFSVFKYGNLFILILQARELANGNIYSYISSTPTGPWRNERLLYHTTEQDNVKDEVFTYNAMAHPQYITDNKLLVSYCVNSFDVSKIHKVNTDYYRPKFIWVPMERILE